MQIKTRLGETFTTSKLTWGAPLSDHPIALATNGEGKWFGPTEIVEITDDPPNGSLPSVEQCLDANKALRRERDEARDSLSNLQKQYDEGVKDRQCLNSQLERVRMERDGMCAEIQQLRKEALQFRQIISRFRPDLANITPTPTEKPPLGIIPRKLWDEQRAKEIVQAMARYLEAGKPVPVEWTHELNCLLEI